MKIEFKLTKTVRLSEKGVPQRNSKINICGLEKVLKLLNYIYDNNLIHDKLGLYRKYIKYIELIEKTKDFINFKNGISYSSSCINHYRVQIRHNNSNLLDNAPTIEEALLKKSKLIKENNTKEYKLIKLINYWDFKYKNILIKYDPSVEESYISPQTRPVQ